MEIQEQPGDTVFMGELWWAMVLDAKHAGGAQMQERYYLSEPGAEGCRRVIHDIQRSSLIPMLAINLEQVEGILGRFEHMNALGEIIHLEQDTHEAWLVWMDKGGERGVQEVWSYTKDPHEAELAAMQKFPGASPLLRAALSTLRQAHATLLRIKEGHWTPIWLDLRDMPRHLTPADLLERKQAETDLE